MKKTLMIAVIGIGFCMPSAYAASHVDHNTAEYQLMKMESPAEDMLDAIDHKDKKKLQELYQELSASMKNLNQLPVVDVVQGRSIALQNSWFDLIALEMVEADDMPALANAINQFSGQLIVSTNFKHAYQKDVAWMDYLGRELMLLNKYPSSSPNHQAMIQVRKHALQSTWKRVEAIAAQEKGGKALIKKVSPTLNAIMHESDAKKLTSLSEKELDLVDNIEAFFHL